MGDEEAEALKLEANQFFAEHKYAKAVVVYSKAIELAPTNVKLLSNRAFAHLKLENYGSAVEDSSKAIDLDPAFIKVCMTPPSFSFSPGAHQTKLISWVHPNTVCART